MAIRTTDQTELVTDGEGWVVASATGATITFVITPDGGTATNLPTHAGGVQYPDFGATVTTTSGNWSFSKRQK